MDKIHYCKKVIRNKITKNYGKPRKKTQTLKHKLIILYLIEISYKWNKISQEKKNQIRKKKEKKKRIILMILKELKLIK